MEAALPSFSIVIEAATLTHGNDELLRPCLESLQAQTVTPARANEVVLMDPGHASEAYVEQVLGRFPWIKRVRVGGDAGYFETKMKGVEHTTGDIILFADSDNTYCREWIELILEAFADNGQVNVVVGETSVKTSDLWSTVFALTFFFPPFSKAIGRSPANSWFGNNSAFRRRFLDEYPVPLRIPLLRGNDYVHSVLIQRAGHTVWQKNGAEALHAAPDSFYELLTRYLVRGSDRLEISRLLNKNNGGTYQNGGLRGRLDALGVVVDNVIDFMRRLVTVPLRQPRALVYYPLAVPFGAILLGATLFGFLYSRINAGDLLRRYGEQHGGAPASALGRAPMTEFKSQ